MPTLGASHLWIGNDSSAARRSRLSHSPIHIRLDRISGRKEGLGFTHFTYEGNAALGSPVSPGSA